MVKPPTTAELFLYLLGKKSSSASYIGDSIFSKSDLSQGRSLFYFFNTLSLLSLSVGMYLFVTAHPVFSYFGFFIFLTIFYLIISWGLGFLSVKASKNHYLDYWEAVKKFVSLPQRLRPSVDIFYTICGEDPEVITNSLSYITQAAREYSNAKVYLLDDTKDGSGIRYSEKYPDITVIRRDNVGWMKKAGNLRNAFGKTSGKYIVIFDADFCPRKDILYWLVAYMEERADVAIFQTPQYFSTEDHNTWVGKGASYIQELFYRLIQVNRDYYDAAICVGTNAIYRREALEPMGGTALIDYSEDVRTGFSVLKNGWKVKYLPLNLAKGKCPDDIRAYLTQQYRWAMGSLSLCFSGEFWRANISDVQKLCFMTGFLYYITTGLSVMFSFGPVIMILIFAPELLHWYNILFSLPSFLFVTIFMAIWGTDRWGIYALVSRQSSFYAHLFAMIDKFRGKMVPWESTGSVKKTPLYDRFCRFVIARTFFLILIVLWLMLYRLPYLNWYDLIPTLFFLFFDFYIHLKMFD